ncbi:MAG: bifunctional (p)ppGpp synthetase/guanosine-3',5'-bis(diphosphate) 3'-pyrophosphohydrolase [Bacillota bacterium]|nr:bifunctional (p)ppGpp synthetase/guanosine-3',5'-bis(diphosphate) 3'-pyrophosphohydrolase [Bacillota bacterium]
MGQYYDKLKNAVIQSGQSYDIEKITKAYNIAESVHEGQKRSSGEDYISHPVEAAIILITLGLDTDSVCAGLLHDTVEDTELTIDDVKKEFGPDIAELVNGVTKLGRIPYTSKEEEQVENLRKMFLATAKDARVIIIKLSDRLHNMRTLQFVSEDKRRQKALETMEVYAPLAHRLGMQRLKIELEDLALRFLDPIGYAEIEEGLKIKENERKAFLENTMDRIKQHFEEMGSSVQISGRIKHVYSIYRKMYRQNKTIDEIYDLYAVRLIVETITECYNALGIIHDMYKPIPGRFKDYISMPKPNMYQSLHTTVIGKEGIPFELQIRTWDMHRTAEFGIAAHWKYKNNIQKQDGSEGKLEWVRKLLEMQTASVDPDDFMRAFKIDFFADEIFVFTPKGDLVNLPAGATVIDFAYAIHSEVGNKMVGCKVNGKMMPLEYQPKNGDIVEIITTNAGKGPNRDWLSFAKTAEAKSKIKTWFKRERREENIEKGTEDFERELKASGITIAQKQRDEILLQIAKRVGITGVEELFATIGYGGIALTRIMPRFRDEYQKLLSVKKTDEQILANLNTEKETRQNRKDASAVIVEGIDNCLIKYAKCCNPLPGDPIVGFITKGYGVSIHRTDCSNAVNGMQNEESDRWLKCHWANSKNTSFKASLQLSCVQRYGLLADISTTLATMKVFIHAVNAKEGSGSYTDIFLTIDVADTDHLDHIISKLLAISGVLNIKRGVS